MSNIDGGSETSRDIGLYDRNHPDHLIGLGILMLQRAKLSNLYSASPNKQQGGTNKKDYQVNTTTGCNGRGAIEDISKDGPSQIDPTTVELIMPLFDAEALKTYVMQLENFARASDPAIKEFLADNLREMRKTISEDFSQKYGKSIEPESIHLVVAKQFSELMTAQGSEMSPHDAMELLAGIDRKEDHFTRPQDNHEYEHRERNRIDRSL